ncbi:hypothetical protein AOQ84DRAFT_65998 [Glonium stellatum]|uniref:Zn(2)-C6 fungal-type domain-containing protein n=1 Tax=Glonium stellatum TaxID=574774 RepID=A0A8E2EY70_9PEZI|nr:hypothetical protein AOQ84DRAFT_65998 [Glonium stellatum]
MHILALPPPCTLHHTPCERRQGPGIDLVKYPQQFSPGRSGQLSYPSPPMSDTQSPTRRLAPQLEEEGQQYPSAASEPQRGDGIPQHADPRPSVLAQGFQHQHQQHYPGDAQTRASLHYQQSSVVENPAFGGVQIHQNYAFGYPSQRGGVRTFLGSQGPGPQVQPTGLSAPPPLRPNKPARRTKAHVASACVNCKKAHLSCDVQRPCGRCVTSGKQDTCKDVQHKKRGRPRLRDHEDGEFGRSDEGRTTAGQAFGTIPAAAAVAAAATATATAPTLEATPQSTIGPSLRADPHRVLRRSHRVSVSNVPQQPILQSTVTRPTSVGSFTGIAAPHYPVSPNLGYQVVPVAFLNLDLVILKSNQAFQDLVMFLGDIRGKNLADLVEIGHADALQRLRNDLRDERDEREPAYMAPITRGQPDPVQSVPETDVEQVSQGFNVRPYQLNFRLPNNQYQPLQAQVRLAKASIYFVTLVVHSPRPAGPAPLLTSYLPPPTPISSSGPAPMSASAAGVREFSQRPPSSASTSNPSSPFLNFSAIRTSLPQGTVSSPSYGGSPSYGYSPTAGPEHGYFPTIQPPSQPMTHASPYAPTSRPPSVTSEPVRRQSSLREPSHPQRLDTLQLPPIRTAQAPTASSPTGQEFVESARERTRRREASPKDSETHPGTPDAGKRRRLNIHEMLE